MKESASVCEPENTVCAQNASCVCSSNLENVDGTCVSNGKFGYLAYIKQIGCLIAQNRVEIGAPRYQTGHLFIHLILNLTREIKYLAVVVDILS